MFNIRSGQNQVAESDPHAVAGWLHRLLSDEGITKVYFGDTSVDPPEDSNHHPVSRIIFGHEGHHDNLFACRGESMEVALTRGSALFLSPHAWNLPVSRRPLSMYSFVAYNERVRFVNTSWDGNTSHQATIRFHYAPGQFSSVFYHMIHSLLALSRDPDPRQTDCLAMNALLHQMRKELLRLSMRPEPASARHIRSILSYLEDNYAKPINLQSVAERFKLHPNHISRLFQQDGGETFTQRLTQLRVEAAKALLGNYSITVEDAAQRCGFRDAGYFRKVFTRHVGVSPSQYRGKQAQR